MWLTWEKYSQLVYVLGKKDTALTKFQPLTPSYPLTLSLYDIE